MLSTALGLALLFACTPADQPSAGQNDNQQPVEKQYSIAANPSSLEFPGEGGVQSFTLETEARWNVYCQEDWLSCDRFSGEGSGEIVVTVTANPDTETGRRATLSIETVEGNLTLEFDIRQAPGKEEYSGDRLDVRVETGEATNLSSASATLSGSYRGATTTVYDRGFRYGKSYSSLNLEAGLGSTVGEAEDFSTTISSLESGVTYYYRAYVTVWDPERNEYVDFEGSIKSFITSSQSGGGGGDAVGNGYLGCYEIPAVSLASGGSGSTGKESFGNTKWISHNTTDSGQRIVTHTYAYNGKTVRNYTILFDSTKKAALWNAFVMHKEAYPDNNVGRSGGWSEDPALPSSWQSCFSSNGYSRGHEVASNYRQATTEANKQTFYYTNQAPQFQTSFNDGVWNSLENAVKGNAPGGRDTLYVVVGLLYENNATLQGVPLPSHFYKLLMRCSFNTSGEMTSAKGVAYIFTNETHPGMSYSQGATTIDAIEQRSGFDFFANVPKDLQDAAEQMSGSVF